MRRPNTDRAARPGAHWRTPCDHANIEFMRCPFCQTGETRVIDSRLMAEGGQVRRRRECIACAERFTTYETAELALPVVVKRDGSRVAFDDEKLRAGMLRALEKRPVPRDRVEVAIAQIKRAASARGEREVPSREIGELVMNVLRELDQVAYVRFASVYRSFGDVHAFREEIERLERELPGTPQTMRPEEPDTPR